MPEPSKEPMPINQGLFSDSAEYGNEYREHVVRIYELYEKSAHGISDRRQLANSYYLTICTTIVGFLSIFKIEQSANIIMAGAGVAICVVWLRAIRSYRDINAAKFRVIHEIEQKLSLRPYTSEWALLDEGKNPKKYSPFSQVEGLIPWVFVVLFFGVALAGSGVVKLAVEVISLWKCVSVSP